MLINRYKLAKADAVVAALSAMDAKGSNYYINAYSNGREQGYHICNLRTGHGASFSENRNSDEIVVYLGERSDDFDFSYTPREENCKNKKVFESNEYEEAAACIRNHLIKRGKQP